MLTRQRPVPPCWAASSRLRIDSSPAARARRATRSAEATGGAVTLARWAQTHWRLRAANASAARFEPPRGIVTRSWPSDSTRRRYRRARRWRTKYRGARVTLAGARAILAGARGTLAGAIGIPVGAKVVPAGTTVILVGADAGSADGSNGSAICSARF